jgi:hypothetical protein
MWHNKVICLIQITSLPHTVTENVVNKKQIKQFFTDLPICNRKKSYRLFVLNFNNFWAQTKWQKLGTSHH